MYTSWQQYYGAIPLLFAPFANSLFTSLFTLFYLLGNPPCCDRIPSTLVPGYSWTDLPFLNSSPSLPIPNSQYPSQISPASRANKDDDSTPASKIRNSNVVDFCPWGIISSLYPFPALIFQENQNTSPIRMHVLVNEASTVLFPNIL